MDLPEVAVVLDGLLAGVQEALGEDLVGVYLRGSLVMGDFDPGSSDLDFFAVTEPPVSEEQFRALASLHERLSSVTNKYGHELEGTYIARAAARRFRAGERHPTIERGGVLEWHEHAHNWVFERWMVREHGVALLGPDPKTLIDPVSQEELRAAVRILLKEWVAWIEHPEGADRLRHRGYQAYVVETMCRALYTLERGELPSKPQAVAWALGAFSQRWRSLVERTQAWRTDQTPDLESVPEVKALVHWAASGGG